METQMDKVSYIIGRHVAADFANQGIAINSDIFVESFRSASNGEDSTISDDDMQAVMNDFHNEMQAKATVMADEMGTKNLEEGAKFLATNKALEGVLETASGLQYKVITEGNGATPTAEQTVETHYEGTLLDGTVFDSSYKRGETVSFPVNGVIAGWTEALQLMKEGDQWELYIPSNLAYGEMGAGAQIAPNATLIFKIELIAVK